VSPLPPGEPIEPEPGAPAPDPGAAEGPSAAPAADSTPAPSVAPAPGSLAAPGPAIPGPTLDEPVAAPEARAPSAAHEVAEGHGTHSANFRFPAGFLWGAATSAQQVEGGITGNDWADWERGGHVAEASGAAADHFHRFRDDFDLARQMEHNAHRFSIEWSRIEPEDGVFSDAGIAHYREVLEALRARGIVPVVTLFHYTMPRWLAAMGGWESEAIEERFTRYVERVVTEYRDLAHWWITLNEPVVQAFKGWMLGQWPPGKQNDVPAAFRVIRRMLRTHIRAYHAIHELQPGAMVSVAKHVLAFTPCNPDRFRDRLSVRVREYLFNQLFIDALHKGALRVPGVLWERLPAGRTLDFIGLNYYTRDFVHNTGVDVPGWLGASCPLDHHQHVGKRNALGWEVYPEGLAHFLRLFRRYRLPILITENGVPARDDNDRWTFIYMHLWQVARAIDNGVPVVGYLYWSLLDNYEWADGFQPRFGLVAVDYRTQKRTIRPSARLLARVIRRNEL